MRELNIDGRLIDDAAPPYVIAEIGCNHGGQVDVAATMIRMAAMAGASAVKFQMRDNATLYTKHLLDAPYVNENSYGPTYGAHREALELSNDAFAQCQAVAEQNLVQCFATAFDERSADRLMQLGVPAFKIASGGLTDTALLRHVAAFEKPVILSTGGGRLSDISKAVDTLGDCPHAILHCTAAYPLKPEEANISVIGTLRKKFPHTVIGWSSHHPGIALSLVAYTFGARILEHHFTTSRANKGTDHAFSLEPKGLQTLIEDLEKVRKAVGDGVKTIYPSELAPLAKMRRSKTPDGLRITG